MCTSDVLSEAGFAHGFSTRQGGVSPLPEGPLDFAMLRDAASLAENLRRFGAATGLDVARLYQVTQVHGARVVEASGDAMAFRDERADGVLARAASGVCVGVRVADCVPVLLANRETGDVVAAHAGWRGVVDGILSASVAVLGGGDALVAAVGPCIGVCCFEVGTDVAELIAQSSTEHALRAEHAPGKRLVDLRAAVRAQLEALAVAADAIEDVAGCTRCERERFHSYRRDGDASGRMLAAIAPRPR